MKNTVTPDAIYAVLSNPSFRLALRLLSKSWISSLSAIDNFIDTISDEFNNFINKLDYISHSFDYTKDVDL
ncbi:unnamed protein product [Brassica rapa subsp. narinosa]|uniref:(rape) hypothetical protein n=1 Tax=Brassica napus TaxID=3708 RepID=A0A816X8R6_BRANA|nr:unnamed protein product [Brassica napus]